MYETDSMIMGRTTSVPKSALVISWIRLIPRSRNLLYPSLVLPELIEGQKRVKFTVTAV